MGKWDKYKKNKNKETKVDENKTNINWLITINLNPFRKHCKIRENSK